MIICRAAFIPKGFSNPADLYTVFPHITPAGINISHSLQMRVLLENTAFSLHIIIRIAGIIRGRALYEEIRYLNIGDLL